MDPRELPIHVSAASFFPKPIGKLIRPFEPRLLRFLFTDQLMQGYLHAAEGGAKGADFAEALLDHLNIRYHVREEDLRRVPTTGATLMVANHPFGFLEGLLLLSVLKQVRSDFRIVANTLLGTVDQVRSACILLNPFAEEGVARENARGLRSCMEWLHGNGLLVIFPAGEVAHLNWAERPVADPKWNDTAARLARKLGCPTVPLFFDGANSVPFQMMGTLHPRLRTLNLPRELVKKKRHTVPVRIGTPVPASVLRAYPEAATATDYLRARVYLLSSRDDSARCKAAAVKTGGSTPEGSRSGVAREVAQLAADRLLSSTDEFNVYLAASEEIPQTLREIGRCREMAFRAVGEGTGEPVDLDGFDKHYQQLFLWSNRDEQIAGGYRLAATPDVLRTRGPGGLYTSTLFHFADHFFERLGPAFELGRSFVRPEYQKHYAPLLLLWKGIAACVARRPECAVLFGAVSISRDYHPLSRALIINFVERHMASELSGMVKPRHGYRRPMLVPKHLKRLGTWMKTIDELSDSISDLEADGKGVPVLFRQYVKLGGRFLGFNVDPKFSDSLDGFIVADVRKVSGVMLDRVLGRTGAVSFRAYHKLSG